MLFNSLDFVVFFAVVTVQYFRGAAWLRWPLTIAGILFPVAKYGLAPANVVASLFCVAIVGVVTWCYRTDRPALARKLLLFLTSLLFYSAWRWPFTSLLLFSTVLDYNVARKIHATDNVRQKRLFLTVSMVGNLGLLAFFKYTNFLLENLEALLNVSGLQMQMGPWDIILPLGISFYTFQTMSYTIDVYRGVLEPRKSILDVGLFVSFFPQLVAGPIVRARDFLPQLENPVRFDAERAKSGLLLMLWGLFKKLLIADALSPIVNQAYANPDAYSAAGLVLATYCFAFQIYCDFSGYSDVAIGAARVLGFELPLNFNRPYFATSITTFWRRWHISLSSWLRDYLYISLGGSRRGRPRTAFNLMATMVLGGLWHGASWNFVIWGAIHGSVLTGHKILMWVTGSDKATDVKPFVVWAIQAFVTFHIVCLTWVFFRAETLGQALEILRRIGSGATGLMVPWLFPLVLIPALLLIQFVQTRFVISDALLRMPRLSRMVLYAGVILLIALINSAPPVDFIYFVF